MKTKRWAIMDSRGWKELVIATEIQLKRILKKRWKGQDVVVVETEKFETVEETIKRKGTQE